MLTLSMKEQQTSSTPAEGTNRPLFFGSVMSPFSSTFLATKIASTKCTFCVGDLTTTKIESQKWLRYFNHIWNYKMWSVE